MTVCVSSQAGCAMGCTFCATGQAGFTRHLTSGEVLEQVMFAARAAAPRRLSNVVFMGMGEPLANYLVTMNVVRSSARISRTLRSAPHGVDRRRRTGDREDGEDRPAAHAGGEPALREQPDRDELVPLNRRYPLERLHDACRFWMETTGRRLSFEWALIDGVNDREQDIDELATYARSLRAHVNLIPLNPTPGYLVRGSSAAARARFQRRTARTAV